MTYDPSTSGPRSGVSGPTMAAIAIAVMMGMGAIFYAIGGGDRTNMSSSSPSATTVGQGQSGEPTAFPNTRPIVPQSK
jgi:hypothetical protein